MKAYTPEQVAEALQLSLRTVRRLIALGDIRAVKIGRAVRIPAGELTRLLGEAANPLPPQAS